mgnify:CR=1 FL=1
MKYKTNKSIKSIRRRLLKIIFTPIVLIYNIYEKNKKPKYYSDRQIKNVVKYLVDYWKDGNKEFYIITDDNYNPFDYSNIKTACELKDICGNKRVRKKASTIYTNQKETYILTLRETLRGLYGNPMTFEEKKQDFKWSFNMIEDRQMYKLISE